MTEKSPDKKANKKKSDIKALLILTVAALIVFGVMYGFFEAQNNNADWLMPRS